MTYQNIGEETEKVEFKKSAGELKEGVVSIASILNKHERGDLYFGVKNNGDVIGQDISETTLREVSQAIRSYIKPPIYPVIEKLRYGDRNVVHVQFEGKRRPYLAFGIPRIRIADEDAQMDQELYREMLNARENRIDSWENKLSKYHISDVDKEVFERYLQRATESGRIAFATREPGEVMTKLELAEGDALLNAGAALFVDSGINELQMAKFASDERLTFTDIKRYTGSIFALIDKAVGYVVDAMDWRVEFDGSVQRKEYPEIPVDAVREAVVNAFGHRSIESMQAVEVAVYKSYVDIYSPGKFPDGVSPEQFITETLKPIRRNPLITRVLYYSKDMESFATGLKRIYELCSQAGVKVEYLKEAYGFTVRFHRHCGESWRKNGALEAGIGSLKAEGGALKMGDGALETGNGALETGDGALKTGNGALKSGNGALELGNGALESGDGALKSENGALKSGDGALKSENGALKTENGALEPKNEIKAKLRELIRQNPKISRKEMADSLGIGLRSIQRLLNEMGDVRFTGGGRNGRWEIVDS